MATEETAKRVPSVYQLKIALRWISPMIWRRVEVLDTDSIADLHRLIQATMGWKDCHLHQFRIHGATYGIEYEGGLGFSNNPHEVTLRSFEFRLHERFQYEYDMRDFWEHDIRVEGILPVNPRHTYPRCIDGKGLCPPEGLGGPGSYMRAKLQNPPDLAMRRVAELLLSLGPEDPLDELRWHARWFMFDRFDKRAVNELIQSPKYNEYFLRRI